MSFYQTYFAGVRWPELILAVAVAILGKLQLTLQGGGKIDQGAAIEATLAGLAVAWAYLRVPKAEGEGGADATGPKDDVEPSEVERAITSVLPPMVSAAAPDLAGNIAKELGRVLKRGIRW